MRVSFTEKVPVAESMVFEYMFEPELWLTVEDKSELLERSIVAYMTVDGELAGEIYGVPHADLDEEIPDIGDEPQSVYVYSVAILPKFQGKHLAKLLIAHWIGKVPSKYRVITAHLTSPSIRPNWEFFGAEMFGTHKNWFDSGRDATFCKIYLS